MKNHHHNGPIKHVSQAVHETIATRAYELWMTDGQPENQAESFWLKAEREQVQGEQAPRKVKSKSEPVLPVSF